MTTTRQCIWYRVRTHLDYCNLISVERAEQSEAVQKLRTYAKVCRLPIDTATSGQMSPNGLFVTADANRDLCLSSEAGTENRLVINELQTSAVALDIIPPLQEVLDGCRTFILSYYQLGAIEPSLSIVRGLEVDSLAFRVLCKSGLPREDVPATQTVGPFSYQQSPQRHRSVHPFATK